MNWSKLFFKLKLEYYYNQIYFGTNTDWFGKLFDFLLLSFEKKKAYRDLL